MFGCMEKEKVDIPLSLSSTSMAAYGYVTFASAALADDCYGLSLPHPDLGLAAF